jgi:hypothetical protein
MGGSPRELTAHTAARAGGTTRDTSTALGMIESQNARELGLLLQLPIPPTPKNPRLLGVGDGSFRYSGLSDPT